MESRETYGAMLRRLRGERRISKEALSEAAGVAVKTIWLHENDNVSNPRKSIVELLAQGLKLNSEETELLLAAAERRTPHARPVRFVPFIFGGSHDSDWWHQVQLELMHHYHDAGAPDDLPKTLLLPLHHHEQYVAEERDLRICASIRDQLTGIILAPACGTTEDDPAARERTIALLREFGRFRIPVVFVDRPMVADGTYRQAVEPLGADGVPHLPRERDVGHLLGIPTIGVDNVEAGRLAATKAVGAWYSRRQQPPIIVAIVDDYERGGPSYDRATGVALAAKSVPEAHILSPVTDYLDPMAGHERDGVGDAVKDALQKKPNIIVCGTSHILINVRNYLASAPDYPSPSPKDGQILVCCDAVTEKSDYPQISYQPDSIARRAETRLEKLQKEYDDETLRLSDRTGTLKYQEPDGYLDRSLRRNTS